MEQHPLEVFARLQSLLSRAGCQRCDPDIQWTMDALERSLGGSPDPLEDARHALGRAAYRVEREYQGPHGEAIRREIASAATSVGRALALRG